MKQPNLQVYKMIFDDWLHTFCLFNSCKSTVMYKRCPVTTFWSTNNSWKCLARKKNWPEMKWKIMKWNQMRRQCFVWVRNRRRTFQNSNAQVEISYRWFDLTLTLLSCKPLHQIRTFKCLREDLRAKLQCVCLWMRSIFCCVCLCRCGHIWVYVWETQREKSLFCSFLSAVSAEFLCCFPPQRCDPTVIRRSLLSADNIAP